MTTERTRSRGTRQGGGSRPPARDDAGVPGGLPSVVRYSDARRAEIAARVRAGELVRARRGVYLAPGEEGSAARRRRAFVVRHAVALAERLTTEHWFSHTTAAVLHGLWTWRLAGEVHVTQRSAPSVRRASDPVVRRHRTALCEEDTALVDGLPVTSLERTVVDCARSLSPLGGIVVADSALRAGADPVRLAALLRESTGGRGVRTARRVLAAADGRSESPGESLVRWIVLDAGLPAPEPNVTTETWRGTYRLDLAWVALRVAVEFDGAVKYGSGAYGDPTSRLLAEKQRHDALVEAGWAVLRVTWADLADGDMLVRRVRSVLARRRHDGR